MKRLRIRCLGGFEVWHGDCQLTGFESQKTKALLAYFLSHRGRALTRDRLAALLWPEKSEEAARRNLRQAVYSLKRCLPAQDDPPIVSSDGQLQWNADYPCWFDVEEFDRELDRARLGETPDPHSLATAVDFYRGDFLTGFLIRDSESFDLWMTAEQERLRDRVLEALRTLVESYLARGEYRFGVQYARRLVAVDALAEEAYRYLMQLYALSGRRSQALAQYDELCQVLRTNMGLEPMPETEALYQAILRDGATGVGPTGQLDEPIGPMVPLVGRRKEYRRLKEAWHAGAHERVPLILVSGEAGVGKSRLVKSFLDSVSAGAEVTVVKGRCLAHGPALYQPFPQLLKNVLTADSANADRAVRQTPAEVLGDLAPLVPGLCHLRPDVSARLSPSKMKDVYAFTPPPRQVRRQGLFDAAVQLLGRLAGDSGDGEGRLAIFLDDLHLAGPEAFDLLEHLRERLDPARVLIVAAFRTDVSESGSVKGLGQLESDSLKRIALTRLEPGSVEEIAASLVRGDQAADLGRFLIRLGEGLPLAIAEAINYLWDEGVLVPDQAGRWNLTRPLREVAMPASGSFLDLIVRRFRSLPSSPRRLAALAAVMGQKFDVELLTKAADELPAVVEVSLEFMLERWLVRRYADAWVSSGRERCIVLWAKGARRGSFEFAHELTWKAIYQELDHERRKIMHAEVSAALEKLYVDATTEGDMHDAEGLCETLAHHFCQAGLWEKALFYLRQATRRARHLEARAAALAYEGRCLEALDHLISSSRDPRQAKRWRQDRKRLGASQSRVPPASGMRAQGL